MHGKIEYKIERGGGSAILYRYKIANLPELLILSLKGCSVGGIDFKYYKLLEERESGQSQILVI